MPGDMAHARLDYIKQMSRRGVQGGRKVDGKASVLRSSLNEATASTITPQLTCRTDRSEKTPRDGERQAALEDLQFQFPTPY